MHLSALTAAGLVLAFPASAFAQGPEQIDQLEPGQGEWQAEIFGTFGSGGEREQVLEAMFGVSERLAVGVELEAEYSVGHLALDTVGLKALYRVTADNAPVGLGVQIQVGFDGHAALAEAEVRLIAEAKSEIWWAQGNAMLRHSNAGRERSFGLGYAWSLQYGMTDHVWVGFEGSGQSEPFSLSEVRNAGHLIGPSVTFEWRPADGHEIEAGMAFFRRIGGVGSNSSARLFIQLSF